MNRAEVAEKAKVFATYKLSDLRECWRASQQVSGLEPNDFRNEVGTLKNVVDGRCPDGCCGNEDQAPWKPTPAEWVVLAEDASRRLRSRTSR